MLLHQIMGVCESFDISNVTNCFYFFFFSRVYLFVCQNHHRLLELSKTRAFNVIFARKHYHFRRLRITKRVEFHSCFQRQIAFSILVVCKSNTWLERKLGVVQVLIHRKHHFRYFEAYTDHYFFVVVHNRLIHVKTHSENQDLYIQRMFAEVFDDFESIIKKLTT